MIDLDDRTALARIDAADMRGLLRGFPDQVAEAWGWRVDVPAMDTIDRIVVAGMGGSAIGGDLLATLFRRWDVPLPITTVRDYALPPWADERTLVIAVSYSGNTEETLGCAQQALDIGCPMLAVTSGGRLAELAHAHDVPLITVPSGQPPRASLGYLFAPVLRSLAPHLNRDVEAEMDAALALLRSLTTDLDGSPVDANRAKRLAHELSEGIPICYGSSGVTGAVARRWKTQLNENAEVPAYWDVVPEINHNELMSWANDDLAARWDFLLLRDGAEAPAIARRFAVSEELLTERGCRVHEVQIDGESLLARLLGLVVLGDWVSYYRAMLREVDPTPVGLIEAFKRRMTEVQ